MVVELTCPNQHHWNALGELTEGLVTLENDSRWFCPECDLEGEPANG